MGNCGKKGRGKGRGHEPGDRARRFGPDGPGGDGPPGVHGPEELLRLVRDLRKNRATLVLVTDEFGVLQGLVTMHDILEAIAGEFPDEGEAPLLQKDEADGSWLADGSVDLVSMSHALGAPGLFEKSSDFVTLAGLLLQRFGRLPQEGETVEIENRSFEVVKLEKNRIALVRIRDKTTTDRMVAS